MTVLITGATGLIGTQLINHLSTKHNIHYLTTSKAKLNAFDKAKGFIWDIENKNIDSRAFEKVDTIVHLCGAPIAKRWTKSYKKMLYQSRIQTTQILFDHLSTTTHQVKHLIAASAIGYYPSSLSTNYTEDYSCHDNSFIGELVYTWEKTNSLFNSINIPVSLLRIGLVISYQGGILEKLSKPIAFNLGSVFGKGNQIQSWIHIDDLIGIISFLFENKQRGIFNCVAPNPITHKEMIHQLADSMKKKIWLPNTPKWVLNLILGEMHQILFSSQKVNCLKIKSLDYQFKYSTFLKVLTDLPK